MAYSIEVEYFNSFWLNKINFKLKKEGDLSGSFLSEAKGDRVKFDYVVDKKGISVNKLKVGLKLKPFLNLKGNRGLVLATIMDVKYLMELPFISFVYSQIE